MALVLVCSKIAFGIYSNGISQDARSADNCSVRNVSPEAVVISSLGSPCAEGFNALASTATSSTLPPGWRLYESGSAANETYGADDGGATSGNTYSYGAVGSSERSLGTLRSGSVAPTIGAVFLNNTGKTVSAVTISYVGEQWRLGATPTPLRNDRLEFSYSTDATSLSTGVWMVEPDLSFIGPQGTASPVPTVGKMDGNSASNRTALSHSLTGLDLRDGSFLWIRWVDVDASSSDDGLAIDDFAITAYSVPETAIATATAGYSNSPAASFTFTTDNSGTVFECSLDSAAYSTCGTAETFVGLSEGGHSLSVRARNPAGVDPTPATFRWTVDLTGPETSISRTGGTYSNSSGKEISFTATDAVSGVAGYECKFDSGSYAPCISPVSLSGLAEGPHTFVVRATDNAGNKELIPDSVAWTVDLTLPTLTPGAALANTASAGDRVWKVSASDSANLADVTLTYQIGGETPPGRENSEVSFGPPTAVKCVGIGAGAFDCAIAGQPLGSVVSYYATATDAAGNKTTSPDPTAPYAYAVGNATIPSGTYSSIELDSTVTISSSIAVTGKLTLSGIVTTGGNSIVLGPGAVVSGAGPGKYVIGTVVRLVTTTGSFTVPVGTAPAAGATPGSDGAYSPVDIEVTSVNGPSSLTVTTAAATLPGAVTQYSLARHWSITESGDVTADLTFHYLSSDVVGSTSSYRVMKKSGSSISYYAGGSLDEGAKAFTAPGVSEFSAWSAGAFPPSAAGAEIEGRVIGASSAGLKNVTVRISGGNLREAASVRTNQFGVFRFIGLETGMTYIIQVQTGRHTFQNPAKVIHLYESLSNENFVEEPLESRR